MSVSYDEGVYLGEILEQAIVSAHTGTPQFALRFLVVSQADGSSVTHQYERKFYRSITEKTATYLLEDLQVLGFTGNDLQQLEPQSPNCQDFTGKQIAFSCSHEDDQNGRTRERWSIARGAKPIQGDPVSAATFRKLNALLGFKSAPAASTQPVAAGRFDEKGAEITDEDAPF
jgi:hypothetical protein